MRLPSLHDWGAYGHGTDFEIWGTSGVSIFGLGLVRDSGEQSLEDSPSGARKRRSNHLAPLSVVLIPVMVPEVEIARVADVNIRVSNALAPTLHIFPSNWEAWARRRPRNLFQIFSDSQPEYPLSPGPAHAMYPYYNPPVAPGPGPHSTSPLAATSPQNKRTHMSTPGESPGSSASKVPKVSRACDYCKSKKTKCSGTRPCGSCVKRGIPCHYDAKYMRGRPPTPPAGPTDTDSGRDIAARRGIDLG